jgi:anti-sigma regulatory factor (Ser/Thr protein kinase)
LFSVTHGTSTAIEVSLALDDGELEGVLYDDGPGTRALDKARKGRDISLVLQLIPAFSAVR